MKRLFNSLSENDKSAINSFIAREYADCDLLHQRTNIEYLNYMFESLVMQYQRDPVEMDINGKPKKERYFNKLGVAAEYRFSSDIIYNIIFSRDGFCKLNDFWQHWLNNQ